MRWTPAIGLFLLWIAVSAVTVGACFHKDAIVLPRDIDRWCDRAQISADVDDMIDNIQKCEDGFDQYNMRDGYAGLLIKNAGNDMSLIRQSIDNVQARAVALQTIPEADRAMSAAYQTGLADLRDTFEQTHFQSQAYYWRHDGLFQIAATNLVLWLGWIPALVAAGFAALKVQS